MALFYSPMPTSSLNTRSILQSATALRLGLALLTTTVFSGCASFNHIANYPTPAKPATVAIVAKPLSKMSELPVGAYYDDKREIVISGHQKGLGVSMLFGVVGVLVADAANKSSAESRFGASAQSSVTDLLSLTRAALQETIAAGHAPQWTATDAAAQLQLSPHAVFTVMDSGKARLYAMLSAQVPGAAGSDPAWSVRYFVRAPGEYAVEGADGWMTQNRFSEAMATALRRAVQVCADDAHGKLTGTKKVKAKGRFAMVNFEFDLPILVVSETDDTIVGRLAVGDAMIMSGTHILNRADYQIKEADFKDPRQ